MQEIADIYGYLRHHAAELGTRILGTYPALHQVEDAPSPRIETLLRQPFPAQTLAIMGLAKRWELARAEEISIYISACGEDRRLRLFEAGSCI